MNSFSMIWTEQMLHVVAELQQRPHLGRLLAFAGQCGMELYAVGGALRDICLGRPAQDVDLAMMGDVMGFARGFANHLGAAYVPLDAARGEARVVYRKRHVIDFSHFKGDTIVTDLRHRDFTINAMACSLVALLTQTTPEFIDPHGGWHDLQNRAIRMVSPMGFREDPLRLLRAFRLGATLDFTIDPATREAMESVAPLLVDVAGERIHGELLKLFAAPCSSSHVVRMAHLGILDVLFPELTAIRGISVGTDTRQDLFEHSIQTYQAVEDLVNAPGSLIPAIADNIVEYLQSEDRRALIKWAALLHVIQEAVVEQGVPQVPMIAPGYAEHSAEQWERTGSRLKLSRKQIDYLKILVAHYGRMSELALLEAQGGLTLRSVHGWCKEVRESMLGVIVLAIGHGLAEGHEDTSRPNAIALGQLAARIWGAYCSRILPVITAPRLVTGHDLQQLFSLTPGPCFKTLLDELEVAQVEGRIHTRDDALQWVAAQLRAL